MYSTRKHKCILAEEIGHILFPPRYGHIAYHSSNFYEMENIGNIKAIVAQDERLALDWATNILMPNIKFCRIIKNDLSVLELADYFDVEPWFVHLKISYIRRKARSEGKRLKWTDIIKRK